VRTLPRLLTGIGAIAGVVVVGIILGWPGSKGPEAGPQPAIAEPTSPALVETDRPAFFSKHPLRPPRQSLTNQEPAGASANSTNLVTDWEDKVDEILGADSKTLDKAKQMLEMFSRLPEAGQVEVVKHLSNLLPDEDYAPMGQLLMDPQLPGDVLDALMADVLNRPNRLKLPALLEVARTAQHPKAGDAKEVLGFFLEGDYGDDWAQWQAKLEEWLKENPD
jgi:hypothetical protein